MPASQTITVVGDLTHDADIPAEHRGNLGSAWVARLADLLTLHHGVSPHVVDATEGGTTVHRLRERWTDDILLPQPQLVFIHVGLSDAWGRAENNNPYAKDPAAMIAVLDDLLDRAVTRSPSSRFILVEPLFNPVDRSPNRLGPIGTALTPYIATLHQLAARRKLAILPGYALISTAKNARNDDEWLGTDATTLDGIGQSMIAEAAFQLATGTAPAPSTALAHGQKILFIGDSITDANRRGGGKPYGQGYLRLFQGLQSAREPAKHLTWVNKGIGGDTIIDIESRWDRDVTPYRPDWLVLYTGINDMNTIYNPGKAVKVTPDIYAAGLERVLAKARRDHPAINLVVMSPFFLSRDDHPDSYRAEILKRMPDYTAAAAKAAAGVQGRFVDLQSAMNTAMQKFGNRTLGSNRGQDIVHQGALGSLVIAESIYTALAAKR